MPDPREEQAVVNPRAILEVLCATHLSSFVKSPFKDRGGIVLVGAPGTLKTMLVLALRRYHDALAMSDVNVQTLGHLRDQLANGAVRTLVLPELAKVYERHPMVASNVEGTLRALAAEGWHAASFENQNMNRILARATVIAALTTSLQAKKYDEWEESGFGRRFLWPLVGLEDANALEESQVRQRPIQFHARLPPHPGGTIPNTTTRRERRQLREYLRNQPGVGVHATQLHLLIRVLAVLKWWEPRRAMGVVREFAKTLGPNGALLRLPVAVRARRNGKR